MKYILLLAYCCLLFACPGNLSQEERFELCPYEHKYGSGAHYTVVPIDMIPHKQYYKVGDTLTVSMNFSDTIYDLAKDVHFYIPNFPFEPVTLLYKLDKNSWGQGYRVNELIVDEKYMPRYNSQSELSDDMRGHAIYKDGRYDFEYQVVFETPGNYCTLITDQYISNLGALAHIKNEAADAVDFEGKCEGAEYFICNIVNGDTHLDEYQDELVYLDKEVYRDRLSRPDNVDQDLYGTGQIPIDWRGVFCFTVEE